MNDYELNCAVAEKLGYTLEHDHRNYSPQDDSVMWYEGKTYHGADYCNDPRDYMKLAIERGITIDFTHNENTVCAIAVREDLENYVLSEELPKAQTGRAVCEAFLQIKLRKA